MPVDARLNGGLTQIPTDKEQILKDNRRRAGCRGGCFDVFAWRPAEILFCEAKQRNHNRLREAQLRWIEGALAYGLKPHNLLVVDWDCDDVT
jgi:hypothetical protein